MWKGLKAYIEPVDVFAFAVGIWVTFWSLRNSFLLDPAWMWALFALLGLVIVGFSVSMVLGKARIVMIALEVRDAMIQLLEQIESDLERTESPDLMMLLRNDKKRAEELIERCEGILARRGYVGD